MHASYDDITSRIGEEPTWFDENAVPRYCAFEPGRSASIHVREVALAEITCQECQRRFLVALSAVNFAEATIADAIRNKTLHYGDPPRHDGDPSDPRRCAAGATMNSEPRRVLEYWSRYDQRYAEGDRVTDFTNYIKWTRDPSLEIDIQPDWVKIR
jgi:hypothetical protein